MTTRTIEHIAILIPARNEAALIERCLVSVQRTRRGLPKPITTDVIVVSDSSTDDTAALAGGVLGRTGYVTCTQAENVGLSRALAARHALGRFQGDPSRCWLANTDADCVVPPDWLSQHLIAAESGLAAVARIIDVDTLAEHGPVVPERFRRTYLLHDDGTHPHVHGANLGVRADAYLLAGGWANLTCAEDHDLWHRLKAGKGPCLSLSSLKVITSGRRQGRAPQGFADALAAHNGAFA